VWRGLFGDMSERAFYENLVRRLRQELEEEKQRNKELEDWADSLKRDHERLRAWVDELKEPPAYGCVIIRPREKDAVVLSHKGLETVHYGSLREEEIRTLKTGQRAFIATIPTAAKDPVTGELVKDPSTGKPVIKYVPGITEIWRGEEAPLLRGRIVSIDAGEEFGLVDEDLVAMSIDSYRTVSKKVPKQVISELRLRPNVVVDCLPETLDIKRVGREQEVMRFEVIERPDVSFDDIGGLVEAKMELVRSLINPMLNPEDYKVYRKASRKVLLHGPPGCGKTMLAQAVAGSLRNCGFYRVNAGEIYHWLLGSSAENLRNIFKVAVNKLKTGEFDNMIVFLDEIDALAPHRGIHPGSSGAEERVVGQLLAILEGFDKLPSNLTVIGATNLPILVDSAVRQRFDKIIRVPQPDGIEAMRDIASKYIRPGLLPIDKYMVEEAGGPEKAAEKLVNDLSEFLFREEEVQTRFGRAIKRREIVTGRLISQMVEHAKERALEDRTIFRIAVEGEVRESPIDLSKVMQLYGAEKRAALLRERYRRAEEIGVTLEHLRESFEKHKVERAEEVLSSIYRYQMEEPQVPELKFYV